jgi:hypothetical protein
VTAAYKLSEVFLLSQAHDLPVAVSPASANHTQVPNVVFDSLLAELSGAQLKVLLYIIRRLAGFHKTTDRISVEQIVGGIVTREGRRLDRGAGVARSTAIEALQYLVENGYVLAAANRSAGGRDLPTTYALGPRLLPPRAADPSRPAEDPPPPGAGSTNRTPTLAGKGRDSGAGGVRKVDGQKKESQNKDSDSNRFAPPLAMHASPFASDTEAEASPGNQPGAGADKLAQESIACQQPPYSPYIAGVVLDFSQALGDTLHGPANVTQALRLWQQSGRDEATFVQEYLYSAYSRVRVYQGRQGQGYIANKMAYFFEVLRSLVTPPEAPTVALAASGAVALPHSNPVDRAPNGQETPPSTSGLDAHKYLHGKYAHLFGAGARLAIAPILRSTGDLL